MDSNEKRLGIWGHANQGINDGFGYAGYKMCNTLNKMGWKTLWQDEIAPVTISFTQPYGYGGKENQFNIGYTPWESSVIPEDWLDDIKTRDAMWTTSEWCREMFKENGVTQPISVVHHGIDTEEWTLTKRDRQDHFIFFHMGEPAERKGGQLVFDAFKEVFHNNPNVYLYYKAHSWLEARWTDSRGGKVIGPVEAFPRVVANTSSLAKEKLDQLYNSVHCLVYPSNGEGFGLIPFQGIATGLPTIFPAWGGLADFASYGVELDYTVGPSNHGYHIGDWAWPDFDDLCKQMLFVYENYESESQKAFENGKKLREDFSWEAVMKDAEKHLLDLGIF